MILITGSTGGLGKETMEALLKKFLANQIAALVRDTEKAADYALQGVTVRQGDYSDYDSLVAAFSGVEKLLLISAPAFSENAPEENVIRAAVATGVKHIFYTSIQVKQGSGWVIPGVTVRETATQNALINSGLTYTIVRTTLFADALPFLLGNKVLEKGVCLSAADGRVAIATREDLGEALANLLISKNYENADITLTNKETWSFRDVADLLSEITGKEIPFLNLSRKDYAAYLEQAGIPEFYAAFAADWADTTKAGEFEEVSPILEELLGRKPTHLKTYLSQVYTPVTS